MAEQKKRLISKGRYVDGVKCEKLLWYKMNDKSVFPETDAATQLLFDQGHEVGALAKKLYKDAIEIDWDRDANKVTEKSAEALKTGKTLFEAGFASDGTYSIADILDPVKGKKGTYDLIEVKMGTSVKDHYYDDVAFQKYNYEKFGIKIRNCYLKHVDKTYVYEGGEIDPKKFFLPDIDINEEVKSRLPEVKKNVKKFHDIIAKKTPPSVKLNLNCEGEHECELLDLCMKNVPKGSVLTLHGMKRERKFNYFYEQGKKLILDLPKYELNEKHGIMYEALRTNKEQADIEGIKDFLGGLEYPIYYLDFETLMNIAVPKFKGTRPYQQIPFQFSLHIQEKEGGPVAHYMYLAEGKEDPRPEFTAKLDELLGKSGTILTYNERFEKGIIQELAEAYPKFEARAKGILSRIKDLLVPFRGFLYYHPGQEGSASIKAVYPAMIGKSYKGLEISEGGAAGAEYIKAMFGGAGEKEKERVRKALVEYCTQDTMAMVEILEKLRNI